MLSSWIHFKIPYCFGKEKYSHDYLLKKLLNSILLGESIEKLMMQSKVTKMMKII